MYLPGGKDRMFALLLREHLKIPVQKTVLLTYIHIACHSYSLQVEELERAGVGLGAEPVL